MQESKLISYIYDTYFQDVKDGVYMDVGANDGIYNSTTRVLDNRNWKGYNLEANTHCFKELCQNRPTCNNFPIGLSDEKCTKTLTIPMHSNRNKKPGGSTLNLDVKGKGWTKKIELEVTLTTYKDFVEEQIIPKIDFLSIDVEGHEPNVVRGMKGTDVLPKVICMEVQDIHKDEITEMLIDMGYEEDKNNISTQDYIFIRKES